MATNTVFKYFIPSRNRFQFSYEDILLPAGSQIICIDVPAKYVSMIRASTQEDNAAYLWAEVDSKAPNVTRRIHFVATGTVIPARAVFIQTLIHPPFVWHIYDGGEV